jgi:hypothetical protein
MASVASPVTKAELQEFEGLLDAELARRPTNGFSANDTLLLACNIAEMAAAQEPTKASVFNEGIESFAPHLVSGRPGAEPDIKQLLEDIVFGSRYHHARELLYYSYNAPGTVDWTFAEGKVEIRFHDHSLPRQFFTTWNEWYFLSEKTFRDFKMSDEIGHMLKGTSEFVLGEAHQSIDPLLQKYADRKLGAYFSILSPKCDIDLGGFSYRDFFGVYRILMMKALYHRHQTEVNDVFGCVLIETDELTDMLVGETGVDGVTVGRILEDLIYDKSAVAGRVDASYFSLMREGAAPHFHRAARWARMRRSGWKKALRSNPSLKNSPPTRPRCRQTS